MQADHVRASEKIVQLAPFNGIPRCQRSVKRIVCQDLHPKRGRKLGRALANSAQAHNAHRLACKFNKRRLADREIRLVRPLESPHRLVVHTDVVTKLEHQRKHILGHRTCSVHRHVRNRNASPAGRDIHTVKSGRRDRDELKRLGLRDQISSDRCLVRDQDLGPRRLARALPRLTLPDATQPRRKDPSPTSPRAPRRMAARPE